MGLYLYSTGASRQQISVMNHLGQSVSYVTLAGRGNKAVNILSCKSDSAMTVMRKHRLGTLEALSKSMRKVTREVATSNLYGLVYDNINMLWKVAEQVVGRTGLFSSKSYREGTKINARLHGKWHMCNDCLALRREG